MLRIGRGGGSETGAGATAVGKKRVIVIDDHQLVLDALTAIIDDDDDFEVVATATSGLDLVALVSRNDPDVVVLDLSLPGPDGIACLAVLREQNPELGATAVCRLRLAPSRSTAAIRHAAYLSTASTGCDGSPLMTS